MPDFSQFPTVSLGIGPITSIYQARFMRYLQARGIADIGGKVWAFLGDGEMDEPESMGAIGLAGRERLDIIAGAPEPAGMLLTRDPLNGASRPDARKPVAKSCQRPALGSRA